MAQLADWEKEGHVDETVNERDDDGIQPEQASNNSRSKPEVNEPIDEGKRDAVQGLIVDTIDHVDHEQEPAPKKEQMAFYDQMMEYGNKLAAQDPVLVDEEKNDRGEDEPEKMAFYDKMMQFANILGGEDEPEKKNDRGEGETEKKNENLCCCGNQ